MYVCFLCVICGGALFLGGYKYLGTVSMKGPGLNLEHRPIDTMLSTKEIPKEQGLVHVSKHVDRDLRLYSSRYLSRYLGRYPEPVNIPT